jgi:hypothetical protein
MWSWITRRFATYRGLTRCERNHHDTGGRPLTAIVMAPGPITLKWCKEALETIPRLRVFLIDDLRDRVRDSSTPCGVNEVSCVADRLSERACTPPLPAFGCVKIARPPVRAGSGKSVPDRRYSWSGGTEVRIASTIAAPVCETKRRISGCAVPAVLRTPPLS